MNKKEYLLTKLIEECLEVAQRATKAMCFGIDEVQPGQTLTNEERLNQEWNDLLATVELLHAETGIALFGDSDMIRVKKQKLEKFMAYSREQGCLVDDKGPAPAPDLQAAADSLSSWLLDNTEKVFEEEPEIDEARSLIMERIERA